MLPSAHQHRDDARRVGLERDELQIEHQVDVLGVQHGNAGRLVDGRLEARHVFLGLLDALLDLADRRQVFVELASIRRTEIRREPRRALADEVEDAPAVLHAARARLGREAGVDVPEQPLEDEARVRFRRHGGRRTAPRNAVGVRARIAGIAVADRA